MRAVFVDGDAASGRIFERLAQAGDPPVHIHLDPDVDPKTIPEVLAGAEIAIIDHSYLPTDVAKRCTGLKHVVFLGTGARSYMNPEELGEIGITVHTIKGYGDTAVAECAMALMWESARGIARMDREMRKGSWLRTESMQLTGKTLGLVGYGGIAAEVARMASGIGMKVLGWNRTPRTAANVTFVDIDTLLKESHVVSMHLLLNDETRGFLSAQRIAAMRKGAILVNTARAALVDEPALVEALDAGIVAAYAADVFEEEPPRSLALAGHRNVIATSHIGGFTEESVDRATEIAVANLLEALDRAGRR